MLAPSSTTPTTIMIMIIPVQIDAYMLYLVLCICVIEAAFSIPEIVISRRYWNDNSNSCHAGPLLQPVVWLFWDGVAGLILIGCFILRYTHDAFAPPFDVIARSIGQLAAFFGSLFVVAWAIVGGFVLWRDNNPTCDPKALHDAMWAFVIMDLAFAAVVSYQAVNSQ